MFKLCKTCKKQKRLEDFMKADGKHRSSRNVCKICFNKNSAIRKKLRIKNPKPPPGICEICLKHTTDWVLDHSHISQKFRGYICRHCNSGIGLLGDDIETLHKAIEYLKTNDKST